MKLLRPAGVIAGAFAVLAFSGAPASAHDCYNTQKAAGSGGSIGTFDVATDTFTPSNQKGNPAFVEIAFPDGTSGFVFLHSAGEKNGYVVPGAKDCDGKGLDNFVMCLS